MCAQFSSLSCSVCVTLDCTPHRVAQVSLVRVISWSSHDERISSTLSPPFPSTSSSSHSSLTSCTSSTTLRAVATLRTSPERRWTLLTTPTSSQFLLVCLILFRAPACHSYTSLIHAYQKIELFRRYTETYSSSQLLVGKDL